MSGQQRGSAGQHERVTPERQPRLLQLTISLAALALLAGHLLWPALKIDATTIGLLIVAMIPWIGPLFESIELPGGWKVEFRKFRRQVQEELERGSERLTQLDDRLARIEVDVIGTTPDKKAWLQEVIADFHGYLSTLGLMLPDRTPKVRIESETYVNAHYDQIQHEIVIGARLTDDPDVAMREYSHHALSARPIPPRASARDLWIIESALADYFPCSFNDNPRLGEVSASHFEHIDRDYIRNLDNDLKLSDTAPSSSEQVVGEVWGGAFWSSRRSHEPRPTDRSLARAWKAVIESGTRPGSFADDFVEAFLTEMSGYIGRGPPLEALRREFQQRGLHQGA